MFNYTTEKLAKSDFKQKKSSGRDWINMQIVNKRIPEKYAWSIFGFLNPKLFLTGFSVFRLVSCM